MTAQFTEHDRRFMDDAMSERIIDCLKQGKTALETSRECGAHRNSVYYIAQKHGVEIQTSPRSHSGSPEGYENLTQDQRRDYETLRLKGGYSAAEAFQIVTAPKTKISLYGKAK